MVIFLYKWLKMRAHRKYRGICNFCLIWVTSLQKWHFLFYFILFYFSLLSVFEFLIIYIFIDFILLNSENSENLFQKWVGKVFLDLDSYNAYDSYFGGIITVLKNFRKYFRLLVTGWQGGVTGSLVSFSKIFSPSARLSLLCLVKGLH